jgi:16S rRNA processing protein RimM
MSSTSSKTEDPDKRRDAPPEAPETPEIPETVAVGRILRPHGIQGELVVQVLSDVPDRLAPGRRLLLTRDRPPGGPASPARPERTVVVRTERPHKTGALVRLEGIEDRDQAEELRGAWLEVLQSEVPEPPAGTYYHYQLLGCRCFDGDTELGEVVELLEDGGGLLLIVSDGRRRLPVPFVKEFLKSVTVNVAAGAAKRIDLELPPGLVETCASRP